MRTNGIFMRGFRFVALVAAALSVAACAQTRPDSIASAVAPGSAQDFVVNVGDRVLFTVDSSDLTPEGRATLDLQARWLQQYSKYAVNIEGHADERGTRQYNIALGARRSTAARDYLVSRGIAANRLNTISYGKERPVAVCNDISCWSQNRRSVTVVRTAGS